jgi:hypothetical protein
MCGVRPPANVVVLSGEPVRGGRPALAQSVERLTPKEVFFHAAG